MRILEIPIQLLAVEYDGVSIPDFYTSAAGQW